MDFTADEREGLSVVIAVTSVRSSLEAPVSATFEKNKVPWPNFATVAESDIQKVPDEPVGFALEEGEMGWSPRPLRPKRVTC